MKSKISPSMMCASIYDIEETLQAFARNNVEYLHIDIMDGVFVPNLMLSNDISKQYREKCNIPLDYHLMIVDPLEKINWFDLRENDLMAIHLESTAKIDECLDLIHRKKAKAGLALRPETPVNAIFPYIKKIDFVLILTVTPGFAGQKLLPETLSKISAMRKLLDDNNRCDVMIEVDGNVSFENAKIMKEKGADIFVAGTSSIFRKDLSIQEGIDKLREAIK